MKKTSGRLTSALNGNTYVSRPTDIEIERKCLLIAVF